MNEHVDLLNQYLRSTARVGDMILFEPPSCPLYNGASSPTGLVAGTLVSWNMITLTLKIPGSNKGWQWLIIPSSWVRGFPIHLSRPAEGNPAGN